MRTLERLLAERAKAQAECEREMRLAARLYSAAVPTATVGGRTLGSSAFPVEQALRVASGHSGTGMPAPQSARSGNPIKVATLVETCAVSPNTRNLGVNVVKTVT